MAGSPSSDGEDKPWHGWREYASANPKPMTTTGLFHLKR